MKKAAFFSIMLLSYYLAGMCRYLPLMVLCVMELFLLVILFFQPRYFKGRLSSAFPKQSDSVEKGIEIPCNIKVKNAGRLPISRFELSIRLGYRQETGRIREKLYGGSECGENILQFVILAPHCGLVQVHMDRIRIYDYLSLFSSGKPLSEEMKIAVFPKEQALHIVFSSFGLSESNPAEEHTIRHVGCAHNEIRQIREYRNGDSNRHIHWNQSAKTDRLWIKEYEKETDSLIDVLLDTDGFHKAAAKMMSMFYELLSALVLGLLKNAATVRVHWYDVSRKGFVSTDVSSAGQCREMLLMLYRSDFREADEPSQKAVLEKSAALDGSFFKLNLGLNWYLKETLIHQFSEKELDSELAEKSFVI